MTLICLLVYKHKEFKMTSSLEFSCSLVSNSLRLHGLQHVRLPCPSPTPRVFSSSSPLRIMFAAGLSSVQFSHSVVSNTLQPHGLQHVRLLYPSPIPGTYPNSCNWISDPIQPSQPLSSPSPPIFNPSQHQGVFKWIISPHQVAKVLKFQLQHLSFQWTFRTDFL